MRSRVKALGERVLDAGEARTAFGRALLRERYRWLQQQIPLLYLIAIANFAGLAFAGNASLADFRHPASALILLSIFRLVHWLRTRGQVLTPRRILKKLRVTIGLAAVLSLGFGACAISLYSTGDGHQRDLVVLFATLAALGCGYALSAFPAAARMPLLLFALPFSLWLMIAPGEGRFGVGASLALVSLLVLQLVELNNRGFVELVRSRSAISAERARARRAEQEALAEKARANEVADSDPLTGLANRRAFVAALEKRLGTDGASPFTVALFDLDGFKPINDTFGHAAGDAVLIEVSRRLQQEAGAESLVARMGGDEFALLLPQDKARDAIGLATDLCGAIAGPIFSDGREFRISACCGLAIAEPGTDSVPAALSHGDAALYSGKQRGRGCVALFTPELERARKRRIEIERALRDHAARAQISLAYQPIFDLATNRLRGFEALARWDHPELGAIAPSEFVPITEQINAIEAISELLLVKAAAEAATWPEEIGLSYNLSAVELCSAASAARLLRIARKQGLDPARLQVEVTETALLADFETARFNLEALRKAGAQIVLDDFGAGFASISYLRELAFDAIKLDGSLVTAAARNAPGMRLLKGVLDMCASLHLPCIAEHIETAEQLALLRRLGCRDGQGYALAAPLDALVGARARRRQARSLPAAQAASRRLTLARPGGRVMVGRGGDNIPLLRTATLLLAALAMTAAADARPRAREAGIEIGILPTGPLNAITDVAGVRVGHVTLIEGGDVRTGVTAILPHGGNLYQDKVPAGFVVGNGYGKFMGSTQILELGEIEAPILLTNTLSVPEAAAGAIGWTLAQPGNEQVRSVNAVVGETNDGYLNDIRARRVTPAHARGAIEDAREGAVQEGAVGAGTGTIAFAWKGGIGTSSRRLPAALGGWTIGVLVQTNYGGVLDIDGVPVGRALGRYYLMDEISRASGDGSVIVVIATDAPLSDRNLERLARRAFLGIGRTGSPMTNGSGDYALAFSTHEGVRRTAARRNAAAAIPDLPNEGMSPLFQAAVEATEEAVVNAMFAAETMTGHRGRIEALPIEEVVRLHRAARR